MRFESLIEAHRFFFFFSALQLFLHFTVGGPPSAGMEMDIIVEKTSTVKEVRDLNVLLIDTSEMEFYFELFKECT